MVLKIYLRRTLGLAQSGDGEGGEFSQDKEINSVGGGVDLLSRGKLISPDRGILFFIEGRKFEIFQSAMKFH
jgi:hypothetical protein